MTRAATTQRVNLVYAWAGALITLTWAVRQRGFPQLPVMQPSVFLAVVAAILATLIYLHSGKLQRWTSWTLCFVLGALFTSFSVSLVAWSSSLRW